MFSEMINRFADKIYNKLASPGIQKHRESHQSLLQRVQVHDKKVNMLSCIDHIDRSILKEGYDAGYFGQTSKQKEFFSFSENIEHNMLEVARGADQNAQKKHR